MAKSASPLKETNQVRTSSKKATVSALSLEAEALKRLCDIHDGYVAVAKKIDSNPQSIYQIISGTTLPSGKPKGVGPTLRKKLDEIFPKWRSDMSVDLSAVQVIHDLSVMLLAIDDAKRDAVAQKMMAFGLAPDSERLKESLVTLLERSQHDRPLASDELIS